MDEATIQILSDKTAIIAKQTADLLKPFSKETALMVYAKQMEEADTNTNLSKEATQKKIDNKETNNKVDKMLEEGKLKWKYADESSKKKVIQMEKIIMDGQAKIKAVYAGAIAEAMGANT